MSREPIIVDGVDVSGCVCRAEEKCILKDDECCFFPNCDYKNWQHKEQECEYWKKELDKTHLLMLEKQDELVKEILKNDQLKTDNEILEKDKANLDVIIETLKAQFKQLENENKDLEIEKYKDLALHNGKVCNERLDKIDELEHKINEMEKGYAELTEIVTPYIDDFTGYNEELGGFDIVLCVKELMQQFSELKEKLEKERALKQTYLTCYKTKHGDIKGKLFKYERYKQALQEIEDIAKNYFYNDWEGLAIILEQILEKCEVLKDE